MTRRALALTAVFLTLAVLATGCRTGADVTMWGACAAGDDPTGTDGAYAMVCADEVWTPVMTVDEFVRVSRGEPDVAIAPVPKRPAASTTTTTTAAPVTTTTAPAAPAPTITVVSPARGSVNGGTSVTIAGTGFSDATAVTFAGSDARNLVVNSPTSITVMSPAHPDSPHFATVPTTADVAVTTSAGTAVADDAFGYISIPLSTAWSPIAFEQYIRGTTTLLGTNFWDVRAVTIGGISTTWRTIVDGRTLEIDIPGLPVGSHTLTVTTAYGLLTLNGAILIT